MVEQSFVTGSFDQRWHGSAYPVEAGARWHEMIDRQKVKPHRLYYIA